MAVLVSCKKESEEVVITPTDPNYLIENNWTLIAKEKDKTSYQVNNDVLDFKNEHILTVNGNPIQYSLINNTLNLSINEEGFESTYEIRTTRDSLFMSGEYQLTLIAE